MFRDAAVRDADVRDHFHRGEQVEDVQGARLHHVLPVLRVRAGVPGPQLQEDRLPHLKPLIQL